MRIMTASDAALLDKLTRLAFGDDNLVIEAMRRTARADGATPLHEVTAYIEQKRKKPERKPVAPSPSEN